MKAIYYLLVAAGLAGATQLARAQAPAALPTPARSIGLAPHDALCGAVQLANHNTLLLVANLDNNKVQVQCLAPDSHTAWQAQLLHRQRVVHNELDFTRLLADMGSKGAQQTQAKEALELAAQLTPMKLYTCNNQLFAVEKLTQEAYDGLTKEEATHFAPGQLWLQRVDEQGQVTAGACAPRPSPASPKNIVTEIAHFAEGDAYYEVVSETNVREETEQFFMDRYDLAGKHTRQALSLPPAPPTPGKWSGYMYWDSGWNCLGHRPGQTYLFRRVLTTSDKQKPGNQPLTYQVLVLDNSGTATGGFATTLGLQADTGPAYSGPMLGVSEQTHVAHTSNDGKITFDSWEVATGGFGNFYLDYATGEVLIYGEFNHETTPKIAFSSEVNGFFARRYSPQGQVTQQVQYLYGKDMHKDNGGDFTTRLARSCEFAIDPLTERLIFSFRQANLMNRGDRFTLFFDKNLANPHYSHDGTSPMQQYQHPYPEVLYPGPAWLRTSGSRSHERRTYAHADPTDAPAYAALEQLSKQAAVTPESTYELYLTPTAPGKALVVERPQLVGGTLRVFLL